MFIEDFGVHFTAKDECVTIAPPFEDDLAQTSAQDIVRNKGRQWMRAAKKKTQIHFPFPKLESTNAAIIEGVAVSSLVTIKSLSYRYVPLVIIKSLSYRYVPLVTIKSLSCH